MHPACVAGAGVVRAKEDILRPAPATQALSIIEVLIPKYLKSFIALPLQDYILKVSRSE